MNKRNFFANGIIENVVIPIDSALATPFNNAELFSELENKIHYPGPDASDPYPNINDSPHSAAIKEGAFALALLSIIGNLIIQFYKRIRKKEAISSYFFFEKLPDIEEYLKSASGSESDKCSPEVLLATAYYYNPDLSSIVLGWRRAWATLTRSNRYLILNKYLRDQLASNKKKEILENIYQQINKNLASYINEKEIYGEWEAKQHAGKWMIRPKVLPEFLKKLDGEAKKTKANQNKTIAQRVGSFISARFDELTKASFVYWIGVFIFYLIPGVGVIGAVVWPPILIAGVFLLGMWISKGVTKAIQARKKQPQLNESASSQDDNAWSLEVINHHIHVAALSKGNICLGDSNLFKGMDEVLEKRKNMIFVGAILNGFIGGFFQVAFVSWLLFAAIGLVVSISPIAFAIIAASTLLSGISWGVYSAWQHLKSNDILLKNRDKLWNELKEHPEEQPIKIPDISLREYDRLFRRGDSNKTTWTVIKQVFKRAWVGFVGIGTGILVLKLSAYGVTTSILSAVGISASIAFFPIMGLFLGGGLLYAAWRVYEYHLESQETQFDNVINSLSHPLFKSNQKEVVVSPESVGTSNNEVANQSSEDIASRTFEQRKDLSISSIFKKHEELKEPEYVSKLKRSESCPNLSYGSVNK